MAGAAAYDNWPNDYVIISLARDANQGLVDGDSGEVSLRKRRSRANYPALVVKRQRNAEEELIHQLDRSETFRRTLNLYRKIKKTLSPQQWTVCALLVQYRDAKIAVEEARLPRGQFAVVKHNVQKRVYGLLSAEQKSGIRWKQPQKKKSESLIICHQRQDYMEV